MDYTYDSCMTEFTRAFICLLSFLTILTTSLSRPAYSHEGATGDVPESRPTFPFLGINFLWPTVLRIGGAQPHLCCNVNLSIWSFLYLCLSRRQPLPQCHYDVHRFDLAHQRLLRPSLLHRSLELGNPCRGERATHRSCRYHLYVDRSRSYP